MTFSVCILCACFRSLVEGNILLSLSALAELPVSPTPALFDSHRQAIGVILQVGNAG